MESLAFSFYKGVYILTFLKLTTQSYHPELRGILHDETNYQIRSKNQRQEVIECIDKRKTISTWVEESFSLEYFRCDPKMCDWGVTVQMKAICLAGPNQFRWCCLLQCTKACSSICVCVKAYIAQFFGLLMPFVGQNFPNWTFEFSFQFRISSNQIKTNGYKIQTYMFLESLLGKSAPVVQCHVRSADIIISLQHKHLLSS